jgi:hypothetical protein
MKGDTGGGCGACWARPPQRLRPASILGAGQPAHKSAPGGGLNVRLRRLRPRVRPVGWPNRGALSEAAGGSAYPFASMGGRPRRTPVGVERDSKEKIEVRPQAPVRPGHAAPGLAPDRDLAAEDKRPSKSSDTARAPPPPPDQSVALAHARGCGRRLYSAHRHRTNAPSAPPSAGSPTTSPTAPDDLVLEIPVPLTNRRPVQDVRQHPPRVHNSGHGLQRELPCGRSRCYAQRHV